MAGELNATDKLTILGNTSVVSDGSFTGDTAGEIALNAPAFKAKGGVDYGLPRDITLGATVQYVDDFPVRFGPWAPSTRTPCSTCESGTPIPSVPGLSVNITAKNVLGTEHREFVGAPALDRMIIGRLTHKLP